MKQKLSIEFIQITQDACLKAFWRKKALRLFLREHHIAESKLATWGQDESKREFLDRLFDELLKVKDNKGHSVILRMAQSLAVLTNFPDLENWEDSSQKLENAREAILRLRVLVEKLNSTKDEEENRRRRRQEASERQQKLISSKQTLESISQALTDLVTRQGTQKGGYEIEKWFYELANYFEIESRPGYVADGRQIDGSLTLDGTTYLVETKFEQGQTGSQDIDIFLSKISVKADNTMGIFVSMAGFNSGAKKTASRDRTPLLLMDYSHFYNLVLAGVMSLPDVILRIRRHASQTGQAYLAVTDFSK